MVGFGPPANRQARRQWWRRQIQRQMDGSLTVTEFCRRLGVSTVSFYAWKRRFREAPPTSPRVPERPAARPIPEANGASTPAFLPVSIRDAAAAGQLEIELANACVVRSEGDFDLELSRIAINAARRLDGRSVGQGRANPFGGLVPEARFRLPGRDCSVLPQTFYASII